KWVINMGDSINNFINLLVNGDFFLIFLIIMMVIIIGVIVYLVRLQIHDTDYYEKDDIEEDDDAETNVRDDSWNSAKKEGQLVYVDEEGNLTDGWESGSERKFPLHLCLQGSVYGARSSQ
ncbi:hypothetical protein, partial [uncultured Akkermansia sp.]|uniref:hypothetical protein n=1 Tax=uncultured Akkermansia sp. TaxID=512294 RepID=UPI00262F8857